MAPSIGGNLVAATRKLTARHGVLLLAEAPRDTETFAAVGEGGQGGFLSNELRNLNLPRIGRGTEDHTQKYTQK